MIDAHSQRKRLVGWLVGLCVRLTDLYDDYRKWLRETVDTLFHHTTSVTRHAEG